MHAERLIHKLLPANDKQRNAVEVAKRMVWWFYRRLKDYKLAPSVEQASLLRAQFDRIFKRRTGYATTPIRIHAVRIRAAGTRLLSVTCGVGDGVSRVRRRLNPRRPRLRAD